MIFNYHFAKYFSLLIVLISDGGFETALENLPDLIRVTKMIIFRQKLKEKIILAL